MERLAERSEEIDRLSELVAAAADGRGATCVIEGAAGIGKTALLAAARELGSEAGLRVFSARSGPLEGDLPWNVVRQLFHPVIAAPAPERGELLSGAAALAQPALGLRRGSVEGALHGLYWLTSSLAGRQPLLLAVDDAHWSDLPSLRYLAYVGARSEDLALLLVIALRSGEPASRELAILTATPGAVTLHPAPLTAQATAALVRDALDPASASGFCAACHRATGGNPFLIRELVAQVRREHLAPTEDHADDVGRISPATVSRSVLLRLAGLPEGAQQLAEAIAVLGGAGARGEVAALAGLEQPAAAGLADRLAAAGILRSGPQLAFVHPLVRDAVYSAIATHERALRHRRAARLLAEAGADGDRVAAQLLASEPDGDPAAVGWLERAAADALERGDPAAAADFLERALREPPAPEERPGLLARLGSAELAAGRPGAADRLAAAAEVVSEPRDRARMLLELGQTLYLAGAPTRAAAALDRGLAELATLDGDEDRALRAELQTVWFSIARTESTLRARAVKLAGELIFDPPRGDSYGERGLRAQLAGELVFAGIDRERALELARSASGGGAIVRQGPPAGVAWFAAAGALNWGEDPAGFDVLAHAALDDARRRGSLVAFATASYNISATHHRSGQLLDAIADLEQAIAGEGDGFQHFLPAARAQLAWALIDRGELDRAEAQLQAARGDLAWGASTMQALVLEAESRLYLIRGDAARALAAGQQTERIARAAQIPNPAVLPWRSRTALAAARLGDRAQAERLAGEELALTRAFGAPRAIAIALGAQAQIGHADAVQALEEAVALLEGTPFRLEHARALVHLGTALAARHRVRAAREILERGLQLSADCQATALERLAREQLLATGARPRRSHRTGRQALTPSELRVAQLAAEGMSNREIAEALFVSLRTVETHLTHAYQKLDITSRDRLGTVLAQAS